MRGICHIHLFQAGRKLAARKFPDEAIWRSDGWARVADGVNASLRGHVKEVDRSDNTIPKNASSAWLEDAPLT
jgi:hypothetical protein